MPTRFDICLPFTLAQECPLPNDWSNPKNFSDDAHDPGGKTMCGITQAEYDVFRKAHSLPAQDVRLISQPEGRAIYLDNYWQPYCDWLRPGLDLQFFDTRVNQGTGEAIRILQVALGVANDGVWAAANKVDLANAIKRFTVRRGEVYKQTKGDQYFDKDWQRRTDEIGVAALKMAQTQPLVPLKKPGIVPPPVGSGVSPVATITVPTPSLSGIANALSGSKTYITLGIGAVVIVANHFGLLPANLTPPNLNPATWITDLFTLVLVACGRSAWATGTNTIVNAVLGFLQPQTPTIAPASPTSTPPVVATPNPTPAAVQAAPAA